MYYYYFFFNLFIFVRVIFRREALSVSCMWTVSGLKWMKARCFWSYHVPVVRVERLINEREFICSQFIVGADQLSELEQNTESVWVKMMAKVELESAHRQTNPIWFK